MVESLRLWSYSNVLLLKANSMGVSTSPIKIRSLTPCCTDTSPKSASDKTPSFPIYNNSSPLSCTRSMTNGRLFLSTTLSPGLKVTLRNGALSKAYCRVSPAAAKCTCTRFLFVSTTTPTPSSGSPSLVHL